MLNRGSVWRRWDPHTHTPDTAMNNQFSGPNVWEEYLAKIEGADPDIEAIGVTDYYVIENYRKVIQYKKEGRLQSTPLIFPNVEIRLDAATGKGKFVNLHLLVSPEDPNHIEYLESLLSGLQFKVMQDQFNCTRADLIRLGKKNNPKIIEDGAALENGANQFKINFQELRDAYRGNGWAKENILIGVAGGSTDGTSGVREPADKTLRREIEGFAHLIFSSNPAQREFWLGRKPAMSPDEIRRTYNGLKPCLHGSDAHDLESVASPDGDRFTWIKGEANFEALHQACIDPADRAFVGAQPPATAASSQIISGIDVIDAPWLKTPSIPLNSGLVTIIGARGSGKTALADMIAAGCDSIPDSVWKAEKSSNPSFLVRAHSLVGNAKVNVKWQAGDAETRKLDGSDANDPFNYERVRYLSQQFVEELCSSEGLTDGLLQEIERVIYEAHSEDGRNGAVNFTELLDQRASRHRLARAREAEAVFQISDRISTELEKEKLVASYESEVEKKKKLIGAYTADLANLVSKGSEERAKRHEELAKAASEVRANLRRYTGQQQTFLAMQDEVEDTRRNQAPEALRQTRARHPNSGMTDEQWANFLLDYKGPVDDNLTGYLDWVKDKIAELRGTPPPSGDPDSAYFPDNTDLNTLNLAMLEAEMKRLERLVNADMDAQLRYSALSDTISAETVALQKLTQLLADAKEAKGRAIQLYKDREAAYGRAFDALVAEQFVLEELYAPLMSKLSTSTGTLKKLSFSVTRIADAERWAEEAEESLLDLRKGDAFRGKGMLQQKAKELLKSAWETGDSTAVIGAMADFLKRHQKELLDHSPVPNTDEEKFRTWSKRFAQWLYSTSHIQIRYGIQYDGVEISKLSPGTRGIVLMLLYLGLDDKDNRPLLIDQPEENLDPKSVFEELVPLFIETKSHRQVILVTHNANLVINTDADQTIIAEAGPQPQGELPPISYCSGGLENSEIRKAVCEILEGGEEAFQERARRLRVRLER